MDIRPLLNKFTIAALGLAAIAVLFLFLSNFFPSQSPCDVAALYEHCKANSQQLPLILGMVFAIAPWFIFPAAFVLSIIGIFLSFRARKQIDQQVMNRYAKISLISLLSFVLLLVFVLVINKFFGIPSLCHVSLFSEVPRECLPSTGITLFNTIFMAPYWLLLLPLSFIASVIAQFQIYKTREKGFGVSLAIILFFSIALVLIFSGKL